MIKSFEDRATEDVFHGKNTKRARKICPKRIWSVASRKLDQINAADRLNDLSVPPGNQLEPLQGARRGQHSIRINDQYRVCFVWEDGAAYRVEIVDYHD